MFFKAAALAIAMSLVTYNLLERSVQSRDRLQPQLFELFALPHGEEGNFIACLGILGRGQDIRVPWSSAILLGGDLHIMEILIFLVMVGVAGHVVNITIIINKDHSLAISSFFSRKVSSSYFKTSRLRWVMSVICWPSLARRFSRS